MLKEDIEVRDFLKKKLKNASVGRVVIERPARNARITIYSSRPGVVIGKKGEDIELLKAELQRRMGVPVHVNIEEIRKPETDAQLIADSITQQLERRIMFRRAMKRARDAERDASGRPGHQDHELGPSERHRNRPYRVVPRRPCAPHTLRADIDYGFSEAETTYGIIGVKCGSTRRSPRPQRSAGGGRAARRTSPPSVAPMVAAAVTVKAVRW